MSRLSFVGYRLLVVVPVAVLAVACGDEEKVSPVGGGGGDGGDATSASSSGSSTSGPTSSSSSTGSGPVLRTLLERNPFGEQTDNLLVDGDFELSFGPPGQQGWVGFAANGEPQRLVAETGGLCRSGLRCARVVAGGVLLARGTAAPGGQDMVVELWAKPVATPSCVGVMAYALSCETFQQPISLAGVAVEDDGWCRLHANVGASKVGVCLYVENQSGQEILLDAALLTAVPPRSARSPVAALAAPPPVSAPTRARMDAVRDRLRKTLPIGSPPELPRGARRLPGRTYADTIDEGP